MDTSRKPWSYYARLTFNLQDSHIKDPFKPFRVKTVCDSYGQEELMCFSLEPQEFGKGRDFGEKDNGWVRKGRTEGSFGRDQMTVATEEY